VVVVFDGIVIVNVPAVTVCAENVWTEIALFDCVLLYSKTVSNEVDSVTVVYTMLADGVQ
jgi:hypothetical protein